MNIAFSRDSEVRRRFVAMHLAYKAARRKSCDTDDAGADDAGEEATADAYRINPDPYPGLRSFTPSEGSVFYGRERSVDEVRERLARQSIAVVLGGSGSGKSSLIRAGLVPRLNSTKGIPARRGNWYAAEFRPRTRPLGELASALAELHARHFPEQGPEDDGSGAVNRAAIAQRLQATFARAAPAAPGDRQGRAERLCDALFEFVEKELDRRDRRATQGLRAGRPSLLLVVDQFEEIFRPEVRSGSSEGNDEGSDFLDLLIAAYARLERESGSKAEARSGLFVVVTMRSEELHRCTEHPSLAIRFANETVRRSLADMINGSAYLLDLLDPLQDRRELKEAIVKPARRVFEDWGLPFHADDADAPFSSDLVDWLLRGADRLSLELEHRPDQLPLLQHALQAIWHSAMDSWAADPGAADFVLCRRHLPCGHQGDAAHLAECLDARANATADQAAQQVAACYRENRRDFGNRPVDAADLRLAGTGLVKSAFRALAQRDDRGNWARRFADAGQIALFAQTDPAVRKVLAQGLRPGLAAALSAFVGNGYLLAKDGQYDISHEALIRNWKRYQEWLREPDEVSHALTRAVEDIDPAQLDGKGEDAEAYLMLHLPPAVCDTLGAVFDRKSLPQEWALEQLYPVIRRPAVARRWASPKASAGEPTAFAKSILKRMYGLVRRAIHLHRLRVDERERQLRGRQFRRRIVALSTVAVVAAFAGIVLGQAYAARRSFVDKLVTFAKRDSGSDFRLRVLLLLNALAKSEGAWGMVLPPDPAREALRDVLLRAPTFGGSHVAAGLSGDGRRLATMTRDGRLIVRDYASQSVQQFPVAWPDESSLPPVESYRPNFLEPIVAGFLRGLAEGETPAIYRNGLLLYWIDGKQSTIDVRGLLKGEFATGAMFRIVEFVGGRLRMTVSIRKPDEPGVARRPDEPALMNRVVEFAASMVGGEARLVPAVDGVTLPSSGLRYASTLSPYCGLFGYLANVGVPAAPGQAVRVGVLGAGQGSAASTVAIGSVPGIEDTGSAFARALGFSTDCRWALVRNADKSIAAFGLDVDGPSVRPQSPEPKLLRVPEPLQSVVQPFFVRFRPLLAAAPAEADALRMAWLSNGGLAVVTARPSSQEATQPLHGLPPLLTGVDNAARIAFSADGRYLTLFQQMWGGSPDVQVRSWDLGEARLATVKQLSGADLVAEACRVARLENGTADLTPDEERIWFTGEGAPPVCPD